MFVPLPVPARVYHRHPLLRLRLRPPAYAPASTSASTSTSTGPGPGTHLRGTNQEHAAKLQDLAHRETLGQQFIEASKKTFNVEIGERVRDIVTHPFN